MELPVLVLAFRRPEHTRAVLQAVYDASPTLLLFVVDGARSNKNEGTAVEEVRGVIDEFEWTCPIIRVFSEQNLGSKASMELGLDTLFSIEKQGVILEDDCLPNSHFFRFVEAALSRYKDNARVGMVTGTNFLGKIERSGTDVIFAEGHIWGWATWSDRWHDYRINPRIAPPWANAKRYYGPSWHYRKRLISRFQSGALDAWDIPWLLHLAQCSQLCAIPTRNTVTNTGHGLESTHTSGSSRFASLRPMGLPFQLRFPDEVKLDFRYRLRYALGLEAERSLHTLRRPVVAMIRKVVPTFGRRRHA